MGAVTVRAASASLNLSYQLVTGEGSAVAVDEVVNLRSTKTSLPGIRRWFECPGCQATLTRPLGACPGPYLRALVANS